MPRKTFVAGDVLTANDVNTFLMDQSVMTFADSTARGSAIGTAVEGMVTYLEDTDGLELWNGAAWVSATPASGGSGNAVINGAFEINQRGFSSSTATGYGFDRWNTFVSDGTVTASAQAFTLGSAPIAGFEAKNFYRNVVSGQSAASAASNMSQPIESVRTFAGQTVTISFYAKAASGTPKIAAEFQQQFGSGGSPSTSAGTYAGQVTLSTSWERHSLTVAVPSIAGKTLGTSHDGALALVFWFSAGTDFNARTGSLGIQSNTFDIWGVQVEAGSTATEFRRNANSLEGELAACQRYFERVNSPSSSVAVCQAVSGTVAVGTLRYSTKRATPTLSFNSAGNFTARSSTNSSLTVTSIGTANVGVSSMTIIPNVASGLSAGNATEVFLEATAGGFLDVSAEL
jgi:hypothetical protein